MSLTLDVPSRAWVFGNHIDTDQIIPSRFLVSSDPKELGENVFMDLRPGFADNVTEGDFVVAGQNFGSGSSREHAPLALIGSGVDGVVAESFARIFFRNCINLGLPVLKCSEAGRIQDGDDISIRMEDGLVENHTQGQSYNAEALPEFLKNVVETGGLETYTKRRLED